MKKTRILCPEPENFSKKGLQLLSSFGEFHAQTMSQEEFEAAAPEYNVLVIRLQRQVTRELIHSCPNLIAIVSPTTGTDHIDLQAALDANIKVFCLKDDTDFLKTVPSTAEHTFALLLSLVRHIPSAFDSVKRDKWVQNPYRGNELEGKTLGILGFGRIGSIVARYGHAFGMNIIAHDPYISRYPDYVTASTNTCEFYNKCEVLSIHVPLDLETRLLVGRNQLAMLPHGAFVLNTSRGAILDNAALLENLQRGHVKGAAIDVLLDEPSLNEIDRHLINYARTHDNLIITPHIGGATWEGIEKTDDHVIKKYFTMEK